jgi:RHS repeat-associated protein
VTGKTYSDGTPAVTYSFDKAGRRAGMTDGQGTQSRTYDLAGRLTNVTRGTDIFEYRYDPKGRLTGRTLPDKSVDILTYNPDDQLTAVAGSPFPLLGAAPTVLSPTTFTYDLSGRLTETKYPNNWKQVKTLDKLGRATKILVLDQNGVAKNGKLYTYDKVGNITKIQGSSPNLQSGAAYSVPYGNPGTPFAGTPVTNAFTYDNAGRLTEACLGVQPCGTGTTTVTATGTATKYKYTYDKVGNRVREDRPSQTITQTYNLDDQPVTQTAGTTVFTPTFDAAGNQTSNGAANGTGLATTAPSASAPWLPGSRPKLFTYDAENRLKTSDVPSPRSGRNLTTAYGYDGDGNRLKANVTFAGSTFLTDPAPSNTPTNPGVRTLAGTGYATSFVFDINRQLPTVVAERNPDGNQFRRYVYGNDQTGTAPVGLIAQMLPASSPRVVALAGDVIGSITDVAEPTVPGWNYTYEPFGSGIYATPFSASANGIEQPFRFTGEYLDHTGLYSLRARDYDPTTGRFLQTDPLDVAEPSTGQSTYVYGANNPLINTDPSGYVPTGTTSTTTIPR